MSCMEPSSDAKSVLICDHCADEFERYTYRIGDGNNFCSKECRVDFQQSQVDYYPCSNCGDDVAVPDCQKGEIDGYEIKNHFCDKECESEYKQTNWVGEDHPSWDGGLEEVICNECGGEYKVKPSEVHITKYCSMKCKRDAWESEPVENECPICGDTFFMKPHRANVTCSDECRERYMSEMHSGEKNPSWQGGEIGYYGPGWFDRREEVIERDEEECQVCSMDRKMHQRVKDSDLNVHHIIPIRKFDGNFQSANSLNNLVTLCSNCHVTLEHMSEDEQREALS